LFRFQVQVPATVNELTLPAYNSLICYKLSDDGVCRLCFVVTEKSLMVSWLQTYFALSC